MKAQKANTFGSAIRIFCQINHVFAPPFEIDAIFKLIHVLLRTARHAFPSKKRKQTTSRTVVKSSTSEKLTSFLAVKAFEPLRTLSKCPKELGRRGMTSTTTSTKQLKSIFLCFNSTA